MILSPSLYFLILIFLAISTSLQTGNPFRKCIECKLFIHLSKIFPIKFIFSLKTSQGHSRLIK